MQIEVVPFCFLHSTLPEQHKLYDSMIKPPIQWAHKRSVALGRERIQETYGTTANSRSSLLDLFITVSGKLSSISCIQGVFFSLPAFTRWDSLVLTAALKVELIG
jgi:hypothetical protein